VTPLFTCAAVVYITMAVEARRARRNERAQLERGGVEPPDDVYKVMRVVYPFAFLAMSIEGGMRAVGPPATALVAGAAVFIAAKALKWWAILALGRFWTFRVLVIPGATLVRRGPYRWLRHPNYVAVIGEIAGVALITGAIWSGFVALTGFGLLLSKRIAVEERALGAASRR
jgi:methyltransferase